MLNLIIGYTIYLIQAIILISLYYRLTERSSQSYSLLNLVLFSLGLTPILTSLFLFYIMLIFHNQPIYFYFISSVLPYFIILMFSYSKIPVIAKKFKKLIKRQLNKHRLEFLFISGSLLLYLLIWVFVSIKIPLQRHDIFIYGIQGKLFFHNRSVKYIPYMFDQGTKFMYRAKHGFLTPLLYTWNLIVNSTFNLKNNDILFRSFSGFYLLLMTVQLWYLLRRISNKILSYYLPFLMALIPAISANLIFFHIDTLRIFYFNSFIILSIEILLKNYDQKFKLILLGICGGLGANLHSLNLILFCMILVVAFLLSKDSLLNKIRYYALIVTSFLLFGGAHYFIDMIYGYGTLNKIFNIFINLLE